LQSSKVVSPQQVGKERGNLMKYNEQYAIEEIQTGTNHLEWLNKLTGRNCRIRCEGEHDECEPDYEKTWAYRDHCFCPKCYALRQARLSAEYHGLL